MIMADTSVSLELFVTPENIDMAVFIPSENRVDKPVIHNLST